MPEVIVVNPGTMCSLEFVSKDLLNKIKQRQYIFKLIDFSEILDRPGTMCSLEFVSKD